VNTLQRLWVEHRQSPWIDFIDRDLLESGRLDELVRTGIRGLTSNPTIFAKAVATGRYDDLVRQHRDRSAREVFDEIAIRDVTAAADHLRPVFEESGGADGFASIEVEPALASHGPATVARARELWARVDRPNCMVKIPGTRAGLQAIEDCLAEGINVNVTLLFGVERYRQVVGAHLTGLRRRLERRDDVTRIASVASFFVSRVDSKLDPKLPERLRGRVALANARTAYAVYREIYEGSEFEPLRRAGAHPQRCLWASTSAKNPAYPDVMYVEGLIGPDTVDTMPLDTALAFLDHGRVRRTVDAEPERDRATLVEAAEAGADLRRATDELVEEGVAAFAKSYGELLETVERARGQAR